MEITKITINKFTQFVHQNQNCCSDNRLSTTSKTNLDTITLQIENMA